MKIVVFAKLAMSLLVAPSVLLLMPRNAQAQGGWSFTAVTLTSSGAPDVTHTAYATATAPSGGIMGEPTMIRTNEAHTSADAPQSAGYFNANGHAYVKTKLTFTSGSGSIPLKYKKTWNATGYGSYISMYVNVSFDGASVTTPTGNTGYITSSITPSSGLELIWSTGSNSMSGYSSGYQPRYADATYYWDLGY
jgi:hypothetical protein